MSGLFGLFDASFGAMLGFGGWAEPPDAVPLRILGLAEKPATHDAIKSAFRASVMQVHPDLAIYTDPGLKRAAEAVAEQTPEVQELVWARNVLLRKVPAPVTGNGLAHEGFISRYEPKLCKECNGERRRSNGEPYDLYAVNSYREHVRWRGYCIACASDAENARRRDERRTRRTGRCCVGCGETFTPPRADGRYCSSACRQKAYRQRKGGG